MPEFEAGYPMVAAISMVSGVSFLVLRWVFGRKGDYSG